MSISFANVSKSYKIRLQNGLRGFFKPEYRTIQALKEVSFTINGPGITGLIGENGAGKSTTIKLLTGILSPTGGNIRVLGVDPFVNRKQLMRRVGIIFGQRSLLKSMIPVKYTFEWLRDIYGVPKAEFQQRLERLSTQFGISELIDRPPRELSLGQRRKCDLLAALLHNPEILLLDEATIGLDYNAKASFRKILREYVDQFGVTVLISSHDLAELEDLCDDYLIISEGRLVFQGTFQDLQEQMGLSNMLKISIAEAPASPNGLAQLEEYAEQVILEDLELKVFFTRHLEKLVKIAYEHFSITDIQIINNSLQQAMISMEDGK